MEDRYRLVSTNIQRLRDAIQAVHDVLVETSALVAQLNAEVAGDTTWSGQNKDSFMAWMNLLGQYHAKLADPVIGPAAVQALDDFQSKLAGFYQNSTAYATLGGVQ